MTHKEADKKKKQPRRAKDVLADSKAAEEPFIIDDTPPDIYKDPEPDGDAA